MLKIVRDKCTGKDHKDNVQVEVENLQRNGYSVTQVVVMERMFMLWGENITEIYYEKEKENV